MKWIFKKKKYKTTKGTSSAVLLSIAIHAGLFLLAGALVVFTVVKEKEVEFEAPKAVERPKMKLKKPKVKVKKTSKPKQTTRIVTKMNRASMPDIQLPEVSGMGDGFEGALGGFEMMPEFEDEGLFGGDQSIGNDFVGTYYDFNRDRKGNEIPMDPWRFIEILTKFAESGWRPSKLARYYRSPKELYATTFMIPPIQSELAPAAFGEPSANGWCFAVHYKGQLVHKDDITFRFWGMGTDILIVRVDGKIVLNAPYPSWGGGQFFTGKITDSWKTKSSKSRTAWMGVSLSVVGDWITLKAGEPLEMEVLIGSVPAGLFQAMLCVEVEGEEYEKSSRSGGPILPIFKTAPPSIDLVEFIYGDMDPVDGMVTNGPVFCDYEVPKITYYEPADVDPPPPDLADDKEPVRTWVFQDGKTKEAMFMAHVAGKVVLKSKNGKQLKFLFEQLSPEDQEYVELVSPPQFNINFSKSSTSAWCFHLVALWVMLT